MADAPAGWYPDPSGDITKLRYWDGSAWTDNYTDAAAARQDAQAQPVSTTTTAEGTTVNVYNTSQQVPLNQPAATYEVSESDKTLRMVGFIFNLLGLLSVCWLIVPLAWMIPMTVHSWGIYKGTKPNTVAFGVCDLIFLSLIGGIFLLCTKKDR